MTRAVMQIREVHERNNGVYGAWKAPAQLRLEGETIAHCRVERLMRREGQRVPVDGDRRR